MRNSSRAPEAPGLSSGNGWYVAFYNSQCCGLTVDYQTTNVAHLGRPELTKNHKFSFSFSLAGIGSFANPLGSFGG